MMKIYAVIDRKAKNVVTVFSAVNDAAAERSFLMLLTGPQNVFTDFPEDFDLYQVADLSVNVGLKVSAMGNENLEAAGFKVDSYEIGVPLKAGIDYDKRYLAMLRADRYAVNVDSEKGGSENE